MSSCSVWGGSAPGLQGSCDSEATVCSAWISIPTWGARQEGNGYAERYGNAEAPEFLATLPLGPVRWVVSSVREMAVNLALLHGLHDYGYKGRVAVTAHSSHNAEQLEQSGADRVLIPYADAAAEAVDNLFGASGKQPSDRNGTGTVT